MTKPSPTKTPTGVEVDGDAVRDKRKRLGHTISSFAPLVEISVGYLSQVERGHRKTMSPPAFHRLATALGLADKPERIMRQRGRTVRA